MRETAAHTILDVMKHITLCAINARYSHSSLALLCLKHAAAVPVKTAEYNINDSPAAIAENIIEGHPDVVGFSCYIWNIEHVVKVASVVKKVLPQCLILLGGPEVSFDGAALLRRWPFADVIIRGAGEIPFKRFTQCLAEGRGIDQTPSASLRTPDGICETPDAEAYELSSQPFLHGDLSAFENRMIYYETSRGCPFRCAYCMSAGERLSFLPLERVLKELEYFMSAGVRQVKLVDRTFNHPDTRARSIWSALIALKQKYPDSPTNFHFEVSASLLSAETIAVLEAAPPGLIQLEIGLQSTHAETLKAVRRAHDMQKLMSSTAALCKSGNLRVYVDLIAGLPHETPESFAHSFDDAYSLGADRLQLGFLKLLPGSHLRAEAERFGIVYADHAPYEVLRTRAMSYSHLRRLHRIEQVVDKLINKRQAEKTLALLVPLYGSAYRFFNRFTAFLDDNAFFARPQPRQAFFENLFLFASPQAGAEKLREAMAFDWLCQQRPNIWPKGISLPPYDSDFFADAENIARYLPQYQALKPREIQRRCVIAPFSCLFDAPVLALFDYGKTHGQSGFVQMIRQNKERRL